jgi:hypothetical protein
MKQIIEKRGLFVPYFGLAVASFAAFLGIMTMDRPSALAIKAVDDFSIGIPFTLACLFIPVVEEWPHYFQMPIKSLNLIFALLGSLFCLLGLHKCFALVSDKAAGNFAVFGIAIFLLIFATGIYELILKDQKALNKSDKVENP